jgi:tetratricopeptide (TPR) repeat protein/nitrous oxidase accessory protein NosD
MTLDEAKRVLGLGPSEDPASHVEEFTKARDRIADMVRNAPNETIALRYQDGLLEFDKAMAAVREEIARKKAEKVAQLMALVPGSVSGQWISTKRADFHTPKEEKASEPDEPAVLEMSQEASLESVFVSAASETPPEEKASKAPHYSPEKAVADERKPMSLPESDDEDLDGELAEEGKGSMGRLVGYAILFLMIGGIGGGWIYTSVEAERKQRNQDRLIFLESLGARLVESRRWDEAKQAYAEIAERDPNSKVAETGIRSIEFGMEEEQNQFVGYWAGEALAAFEAGRIDEAEQAAKKVLEKYPKEQETVDLLSKIETERLVRIRQEWGDKIRASLETRDWSQADSALGEFSVTLPDDPMIQELASLIERGKEQQRRDEARARELSDAARLRDQGKFDPQALEWMREALALAPNDAEVKALYEKLASYSRTIHVPEDVKTLAEAISGARDRDRIVLGEGTFEAGVVINSAVQLEGAGEGKTLLTMAAQKGPVLTFGPDSKGATVTGLVLQHEGFDAGTSRYPIALVRGSEMEFFDCVFLEGSGHGLAVVDGGHALAQRCVFKTNGWDGAAASGEGSRITISESESTGNFGHGIEIWDGASAVVKNSKSSRNSRNGLLVDSAGEGIEVTGCQFFGNREYGLVLSAGASGKVRENSCYANMLGGLVVRFAAISVVVEGNKIEENSGPGLILEQGLRAEIYEGNQCRSNEGDELMSGVKFAE